MLCGGRSLVRPQAEGRPLIPLLTEIFAIEEETAQLLAELGHPCARTARLVQYLVLVLHGEQGSGETTAAKVLRSLSDPSAVPLRTPPRESRDLIVAARSAHVVAYDNLFFLPQWLSDGASMIATGGGYEARQLSGDLDEVLVRMKRPILLNGIENPAVSADLLDRSLVVAMKPIDEKTRRSEEEIDADLADHGGELVGAVFRAVAGALSNEKEIPRPAWARMVDATRWALAASEALGSSADTVEQTMKQNRVRRDELVLEGSVFAMAILEFAIATRDWEGTTAQFKKALDTETEAGRAHADNRTVWPQSIQKVVAELSRTAPILRRQGVEWKDAGRRGGHPPEDVDLQPGGGREEGARP